jgi:ribA/ribD-fused uncharacterized protein
VIKEFQGNKRWLSNFTAVEVVLDGVTYPSTENAYQAAKTLDAKERVQFESIPSGKAKRAGKSITIRPDWDDVKLSVMEDLNRKKYSIEPFRRKLLLTGNRYIQEGNSWGDTFWGVCKGQGENHLGNIIMSIRDDLNKEGVA